MTETTTKKNITCFIFDDEIEARKLLENLLNKVGGIEIVGSATVTEEAIEQVLEKKPEVVFMDIEMPGMNGFEAVKKIRSRKYFPTFIFVTAFNHYAIKALKSAAFDYLLKPVDLEELAETISRFRNNNRRVNKPGSHIPGYERLTDREKEVLEFILDGLTSREIAKKLFISKTTVDTHRRNILTKTGATSTIDLLRLI